MASPGEKRPWKDEHGHVYGYILRNARGRDTYFIKKQVDGKRYELSTHAHTAKAAFQVLQRFEADPKNFKAAPTTAAAPVHLDDVLAQEYLTWCRDVRKQSPEWVVTKQRHLAWWADHLKGVDLRKASLTRDIEPALEEEPKAKTVTDGRATKSHRIATLKGLYTWLRKCRDQSQGRLSLTEDPVFKMLDIPQPDPTRRRLKDKAVLRDHHRLARKHLVGHWRWALDVQAATGWHNREVVRFAKGGSVEAHPNAGRPGFEDVAGVLVCPQAKDGQELRTPVGKEALAAGKKLLDVGHLSVWHYTKAIKAACLAAGIPVFTPGRMRHSVATWAINAGADPALVSAFLNHRSATTTRKFYATHAVPAKVPTLL